MYDVILEAIRIGIRVSMWTDGRAFAIRCDKGQMHMQFFFDPVEQQEERYARFIRQAIIQLG